MKVKILRALIVLIFLANFIVIYLTFKNTFRTMYAFIPTYISLCMAILILVFFISKNKKIKFFILITILQSGSIIIAQKSTEHMTISKREKLVIQKIGNKKAPMIDYEKIISINENSKDTIVFGDKYTIINFWATWCPPCLKEMPLLQDFYNQYSNNGVEVIGITGFYRSSERKNKEQTLNRMKEMINKFTITYNVVIDKGVSTWDSYMAKTLPLTILIDENHIVRDYKIGIKGAKRIMKKVKKELETK